MDKIICGDSAEMLKTLEPDSRRKRSPAVLRTGAAVNLWYNRPCHSHAGARLRFSSKSRLSVTRSHDCDKHEKQQVGGSLIRGTMKQCSRCREWKDESQYYVGGNPTRALMAHCKKCHNEASRAWAKSNRDKVLKILNRWVGRNIEKHRANTAKWKAANSEKDKERKRKYNAEHKLENAIREHNRRARIKKNGGVFTKEEWENLLEKCGNKCLRCGKTGVKLEIDHVIPVALGGPNTIDNLQPLCRKCNSSKSKKHIDYRSGLHEAQH